MNKNLMTSYVKFSDGKYSSRQRSTRTKMKTIRLIMFGFIVFGIIQVLAHLNFKKIERYFEYKFIKLNSQVNYMKVRQDDTFVVGYPKSGTVWISEIVWLLKNDLNFDRTMNETIHGRVKHLDFDTNINSLDLYKSPRVFRSHLLPNYLPEDVNHKAKIVYILRNPKDVITSMYYFMQGYLNNPFKGSIDDVFEIFRDENHYFDVWWDHVNQFTSLENVHIIHYEDLLEKTNLELKRLATYLNCHLNEQQLNRLKTHIEFKNMKDLTALDYLKEQKMNKSFSHLRKGEIGNWKKHFNQELSDKVDRLVRDKLKYKGKIKYESNKYFKFN